MTDHAAAVSRPTLGFAIEGLSGRDETLFKAIVRLLDHRTLQRWVYRPGSPDLRVVCDSGFTPEVPADAEVMAPDIDALPPLLLTISAEQRGPHCLSLPIRADALEAELNSLGVERVRICGHRSLTPSTRTVQLLRWPSAQLLGTPERVRLATLMVSKPVTLAWVQERAGLPPAACAQFFAELHDAGMLAASPSPDAGESRTMSIPASAVGTKSAAAAAAPTGLLARIRSRLGLLARVVA